MKRPVPQHGVAGTESTSSTLAERAAWERRFSIATVITGVISGVMTYLGLMLLLGSMLQSLLLALVSVVLQVTCYRFLISQYGKASPSERGTLWGTVMGPVIVVVFLTSTFLAFYYMGVPQARKHDFIAVVEQGTDHLKEIKEKRGREAELAPVMKELSQRYADLVRAEVENGAVSGRRGHGKTASNLQSLAGTFRQAKNILLAEQERSSTALAEADRILLAMREIASQAGTGGEVMGEATQRFSAQLLALNAAIERTQNSPVDSVVETVRSGLAQQRHSPITARTRRGRRRQQRAADAVLAIAQESEEQLRRAVADLDQRPVETPAFRLLLPLELLQTYFHYVFWFLAYALAFDLLIPGVAIVSVAYLTRRLPREEPDPRERGMADDDDTELARRLRARQRPAPVG